MPDRPPVPPKAVRPKPHLKLVVPPAGNPPPAAPPHWVDELVRNLNRNVSANVPTP
jgi:hypothetical protein